MAVRREHVLATVWILAVAVASVEATALQSNNFLIFRTAWFNLQAGADLYGPSTKHWDVFLYPPPFALLFAPFASVPFLLGVLLWNGANAGALYWGLGRVLGADLAFAARAIVFMDTFGAMQIVQSNALVAGLMLLAVADLERRRELRAAIAIAVGSAIKVFPLAIAAYAIFRPYRLPRFALVALAAAAIIIAAPLIVASPQELADHYRAWGAMQRSDATARGFSLMFHLQLWFGMDWPNWPVQLAGIAILLAPLARVALWGQERFRVRFLASVLMFCVLFNHRSESATFVLAAAGIATWFAMADRNAVTWTVLAVAIIGTVLSSSEAMPHVIQERFFEPYRVKTLPVLFVWLLTQVELWRAPRNTTSKFPSPGSPARAPATSAP